MSTVSRFVGLDVHKESIAMAVAECGRDEPRDLGRLAHDVPQLRRHLQRLGPAADLLIAYEAGPTGYGLCRRLRAEGYACEVIAPSKMPRRPGDRVKTDRLDARRLAHALRAGELAVVVVPDESTEALRDLARTRDDAKRAERTARQQLLKFLLRHDRRFAGRSSWTATHMTWLAAQHFERPAQQLALLEMRAAVAEASARVARLDQAVSEQAPASSCAALIAALQALRGVRLLTAATLATELGDLRRFPKPTKLMGYLGLVSSETSSGERTRRGPITKTGNGHARRALIEAAWSYRFPPRQGRDLRRRSAGLSPEILAIAWKAQHRLHLRYRRLLARGKCPGKAITAIARELCGFVWAIGQHVSPATT